ncbi:hypothetical protein BCAR13_2000005 [Paraburkholderia caribensis]|nr:hypothetical protein BCAR13_2000005 [Paraburkholderia caribensis]
MVARRCIHASVLQEKGTSLEALCCGRGAMQYRPRHHAANDHIKKLLHCTSFLLGKTLYFFLRENPASPTNRESP